MKDTIIINKKSSSAMSGIFKQLDLFVSPLRLDPEVFI